MCVLHLNAQEPEDGLRSLKAETVGCCELPNTDPLQEKYVL